MHLPVISGEQAVSHSDFTTSYQISTRTFVAAASAAAPAAGARAAVRLRWHFVVRRHVTPTQDAEEPAGRNVPGAGAARDCSVSHGVAL